MPSRVWSHISDYAAMDANGKAMIIGEFDQIFAKNVPIKYHLLYVSVKWSGSDKETFTHAIRITSPSRNQIAVSNTIQTTINGGVQGIGNHVSVNAFMMVDLPDFGEYAVEILLDGNPVHIMPLTVVRRS